MRLAALPGTVVTRARPGHHGFAGIEREVVGAIGSWIVSGRAGAASR